MADPQKNAAQPDSDGLVWSNSPATVSTGSPASAPTPSANQPAGEPDEDGLVWKTPGSTDAPATPTLRQQLLANTEPLPTDTGHPLTNISNFGQDILRRGARVIGTGLIDTFDPGPYTGPQQLVDQMKASTDYAAPIHSLIARGQEFGREYQHDPGVAVANAVGDAGATAATAQVAKGVVDTAGAGKAKVEDFLENRANPLKSAAHRGFVAVLDQGKAGMGKNFDAEEVGANISPIVQQEIQSNPTLRDRLLDKKATPKETYEAFQEAVHNAQSHIDQEHLEVLRNVKNQPVDVKPILNAIDELKTEGMAKYAPEDLAELQALKERIASVDTLGELNGLRMFLNNQTSPTFKMSGVAVQRSATLDKAMNAASSATRDVYYDGLSNATGQDFKSLKRTESNLLTAREALENAKGPLVSKEIQFNRPTTGKQKVGAVADAVTSVVKGDKKKIASAALLESPMAQTRADIRRYVEGIPGSVPDTFKSGVQTPDHLRLPKKGTPETVTAETTPNPRPSGPPEEVGGGGTAPAALPQGDVRSFIRRSAPFGSVIEDTTPQLNPSGEPAQQALPQGQTPQALPSQASNSRHSIAGKPHPGLNRSTAVDRTARPIYPKPGAIENGTIRVTPEGEAHIQREGLPAPAKKAKKKSQ